MEEGKMITKAEGVALPSKELCEKFYFELSETAIDDNQEIFGILWRCSTNLEYHQEMESIYEILKSRRVMDSKIEQYLMLLHEIISFFKNTKDIRDQMHYIEDMPFLSRTKNVLIGNNIFTIEQLCREFNDPKALLDFRGFGKKSYQDLIENMHRLGFYFKDELPCKKAEHCLIDVLDLDRRALNVLKKQENVYYIQDFLNKYITPNDIYHIENVNTKLASHIIEKFHEAGFALKSE